MSFVNRVVKARFGWARCGAWPPNTAACAHRRSSPAWWRYSHRCGWRRPVSRARHREEARAGASIWLVRAPRVGCLTDAL